MLRPSALTTGFDALNPRYSPQWVTRVKSRLFGSSFSFQMSM